MEIYFTHPFTWIGKYGYILYSIQDLKKKSSYITVVVMQSLFEDSLCLYFRVYLFLPVSERWLVLHRRSNFRFPHTQIIPTQRAKHLVSEKEQLNTVKHAKYLSSLEIQAFSGFKICPQSWYPFPSRDQ